MNKIDNERYILELSYTTLRQLYGDFVVDKHQTDSPDAAIIIDGNKTIGIEITSVDKPQQLQYLNDKNIQKDKIVEEIDNLNKFDENKAIPNKKIKFKLPLDYITSGALKKSTKFSKYSESHNYKEIILLTHSDFLQANKDFFYDCHKPYAEYVFSKSKFPFDKVIFVCTSTQKSILIYDKKRPQHNEPNIDKGREFSATAIEGPMIPIGKTVNLKKIFSKEPLIKYKSKSKQKADRKSRKKAERKSRKKNR